MYYKKVKDGISRTKLGITRSLGAQTCLQTAVRSSLDRMLTIKFKIKSTDKAVAGKRSFKGFVCLPLTRLVHCFITVLLAMISYELRSAGA